MGGGKSQPAPVQATPMEQAQAQIQIDNSAAQRTQQAAATQKEAAAVEKRDLQRETADKTAQLYSGGQTWGQNKVGTLGYNDNYGLLDAFNNQLTSARTKVPTVSDNVGSYFDYDNLWSNATNSVEGAQKTKLDNQYRDKTKVGWQNDYFANNADDGILDAILGEQYGQSFDTIDQARARGQMSQGAFDNTIRGLDQKKLGARSTLEDMGLGVLGGYRDELTGISKQYGDQVTNYKLGQNFNLDDMSTALTNRKNDLSGRLQGDIYRAVGDTNLFNTDSLIAKGGAAAGVSNSPLRNAFRDPTVIDPTRTTGTTGVF